MSKYDNLKSFKEAKARTNHICPTCGAQINQGDIYHPEEIRDKFLHSLRRNKLCKNCYEKIDKRKICKAINY